MNTENNITCVNLGLDMEVWVINGCFVIEGKMGKLVWKKSMFF